MAALGSQSIASSYEQLLHVDADGGGNSTTHVSVKDGDNGTTFGFTIASDALMMTSTNRLEFGDNGTYINQSSDGVLAVASDGGINVSLGSSAGNDFNIDSGGFVYEGDNNRVGIGTASPNFPITILSADGSNAYTQYLCDGVGTEGGDGFVVGLADSGPAYVWNQENTNMIFGTNGTTRMTIDSSGNINIPGLTASSDVQTDASKNLVSTSDSRLKNDLGEIADGLSIIQNLTPRYFSWKDDENNNKQLGFFAQEVFEHLPESAPREEKMNLVSPETESQDAVYERALDDEGNPDWNWGFNGRPIIAMLVKAVQELSAKVEALEG